MKAHRMSKFKGDIHTEGAILYRMKAWTANTGLYILF